MLLTLDIGNTNITAGLFEGTTIRQTWRFATRRDSTGDELGSLLYSAMGARGVSFDTISGLCLCSVVPSLSSPARFFGREYLGVSPIEVGRDFDFGLKNGYDDPKAVGADRLVNGVAAREIAGGRAVVVADFGTATTIDAVSGDGTYLGGAIAPGIGISSDALFRAAAKLPRVELLAPPSALATNTPHSIQAGLVFGYAGLTKELVSRVAQEIEGREGSAPLVIATGGLAELIAPLVPQIDQVEADLTLQGLRMLWERSRE
ncbi:type III pantothenate kinase [bacterium]|nr:MAG: type III pantothenate kinase [bacterium]